MKRLFIFTYPKLTAYFVAIVAAYFVFQIPSVYNNIISFNSLIYVTTLLAGFLFSAGFSTPIATGFFLALQPPNIYTAALIGGIGALIADIGIFSFVRLSFTKEFHKIEKTHFIRHILNLTQSIPPKIRKIFVYVAAFIIITSPLPDELAITMFAGFTRIHPYAFAVMSYLGNVLGIYLLLSI